MATIVTPDLNLLRAFAMVYEGGSFAAAAKQMQVPRSTVSRAVAALEELVGEPLFHRTTRSMAVTEAGVALYDRVAPSLASLSGALADLPVQQEELAGTVTVTTTVDIANVILAEATARFTARWPKVKVDLLLTPKVVDFARERIDIALRIASELPDSDLVARKVGTVEFALYAAPSYLARRGAPRGPADFPAHDWVGFRSKFTAGLAREILRSGVSDLARIQCDDMYFLRECVRRGAGIAPMPTFLADEDRKAGLLVRVMPRWTFSSGTVFIVHREPKKLPARVIAYRDIVLELLRQRPLGG